MPLTRDERGYVPSLPVETLGSGGNGTDLRLMGTFRRLSMTRSSCTERMEPLEGMGFLTESGSIRSVQRDVP